MTIRGLMAQDWPAILNIQNACYAPFMLESLAALQAKSLIQPNICCVADDASSNTATPHISVKASSHIALKAYCLTHAWPQHILPSLHSRHVASINSSNLFLHDLAVHPSAQGQGLATKMFTHVSDQAIVRGFRSITLVAVQGSAPFWAAQGFEPMGELLVPASYGEDAQAMMCELLPI